MTALTLKWISSDPPERFYLSRTPSLCNLIPLNAGPRSQFDWRRRAGRVAASWRWNSIKLLLLRLKRVMNKDVGYNYGVELAWLWAKRKKDDGWYCFGCEATVFSF